MSATSTGSLQVIAVIPAYNEGTRIAPVIKNVLQHVNAVLVVNDCSTDNSAQVAEAAGAHVINMPVNGGAGSATRTGCEQAIDMGADVIVTIDADGQHDPDEIPKLVTHLLQHQLDIVFGGRPRTPNMPFENRFGNHLLSVVSKALFRIQVNDILTGFHAFTATAFPKLKWKSNRYSFVSEMVYRVYVHHLKYAEVPVSTIYHDKKKGMRKRDGIKTLFLLLKWKLEIMWCRAFGSNK